MSYKKNSVCCHVCGYEPKDDSEEGQDNKRILIQCSIIDCKAFGCNQDQCLHKCTNCLEEICYDHWWQCCECDLNWCTGCSKGDGFDHNLYLCPSCNPDYVPRSKRKRINDSDSEEVSEFDSDSGSPKDRKLSVSNSDEEESTQVQEKEANPTEKKIVIGWTPGANPGQDIDIIFGIK